MSSPLLGPRGPVPDYLNPDVAPRVHVWPSPMAYIGNGHRRPAEVASTPEATAALRLQRWGLPRAPTPFGEVPADGPNVLIEA